MAVLKVKDAQGNWVAVGAGSSDCLLIARIVAINAQNPITFTAIPQTFESLMLIASAKGVSSAGGILLRFNGDETANYDGILGVDRTSTGTAGPSQAEGSTGFNSGSVGIDGGHWVSHFPGYRSALKKVAITECCRLDAASPFIRQNVSVMAWRNTAIVTQIGVFLNAGGGFAAGSTFSLYGIN